MLQGAATNWKPKSECEVGEKGSNGADFIASKGGINEETGCYLDDDLSVLPRHTKVIITGNNRTKSVLVGLHGVVKKAVGLGGWHWLVLTNGLEVKLQRNALSVLEPPTGLEEDEDESEELLFGSKPTIDDFKRSYEYSKMYKPRIRTHKPNKSYKGQMTNSSSIGSKTGPPVLKVDLSKLTNAALVRYWRHFNLLVESGPNPTREQLVDAVERHFSSQQLDEFQVVAQFIQAAKRLKTVYG